MSVIKCTGTDTGLGADRELHVALLSAGGAFPDVSC